MEEVMRVVHKFELRKVLDSQIAVLPKGAQFLSLSADSGSIYAYYLVNPLEKESTEVAVTIVWTGRPFAIHPSSKYLGTVQVGGFVYHAFIEGGAE